MAFAVRKSPAPSRRRSGGDRAILLIVLCLAAVFASSLPVAAQDNEECFFCHGEPDASMTNKQGAEHRVELLGIILESDVHRCYFNKMGPGEAADRVRREEECNARYHRQPRRRKG